MKGTHFQKIAGLMVLAWQVAGGAGMAAPDLPCQPTPVCCCAEAPSESSSSGCCGEPEPAVALTPLPSCPCPHLLSPEGGAEAAVLSPGGPHSPQRLLVQTLDESVQALDGACPRANRPAWAALAGTSPGQTPPLWRTLRAILR